MHLDEKTTLSWMKRLVRKGDVKAADRTEFFRLIVSCMRIAVPRKKRRSVKLEQLEVALTEGLSKRNAADRVLVETDPSYPYLPPDLKARARGKLLANFRAHCSYYRRRKNRQRAKPRGR